MAADEPDARVVALSKELERHGQRVDRAEKLLRVLSEDLAALAEEVRGQDPEPTGVRSWLLVEDTEQARQDLGDLIAWLGAVYLRYPDAGLPSCWLWHPAVIEELWWLFQAHQDAYTGPQASYTRAADWHDRQRPGVAERVRRWLRSCELAEHHQAHEPAGVPLVSSADRIAHAWTTDRSTPKPTPDELTHASQHDHDQLKKTRR